MEVRVRVEGYTGKKETRVRLPRGARVRDLLPALAAVEGGALKPFIYDTATGRIGVFMVMVGKEVVRLPDGLDRPLSDGDEVFIVSPLGGG